MIDFLLQALKDEDINPDEHVFEGDANAEKKSPSKANKENESDGGVTKIKDEVKDKSIEGDDDDPVQLEDVDDLIIKDEDNADGGDDEVVDEVGEVDKQDGDDKPDEEIEKEPTEAIRNGNSMHDGTTVDNEDSLNLTIGEDEEKIFEVSAAFLSLISV